MNIEVIREDPTGLTRQVWGFWVTMEYGSRAHINVVLDAYSDQSRPSARHKYVPGANYQRVDRRNCSIQNVENVPRPDDVRYEAAQQAKHLVRVVVADARGVVAPFRPDPEEIEAREPLRWEPVPYGRGDVEAFVDVPDLGRYLVRRAGKGSREFRVTLNNTPVPSIRGTSDECKRAVQLAVDRHRVTKAGL